MKRYVLPVLLLFLVTVCGAGCTIHRPISFVETSYVQMELEANNFEVAKLGIQATSSCPYLFGIPYGNIVIGIPLSTKTDLLNRAMTEIHEQANVIGKSAVFHNINVEWSVIGVPFIYIERGATITADVYVFTDDYEDYRERP